MSRTNTLSRVLAVLGVVVGSVVALSASPAQAEGSAVTHPFYADSGDSCRFGVSSGTLTWIARGPLPVTAVDVAGTLTDRPLLNDPSTACRDARYSSVTFTAYRGLAVVDSERQRADNGQVGFRFQLTAMTTVITPIDRVVVQVCRHALTSTVPDYCGRAVEYRVPPSPWA
jgi:hypothetical protein